MASLFSIMISSRNVRDVELGGVKRTLSDFRMATKKELEAASFLGQEVVEVWINEDAPPAGADEDSWEHCMRQVRDADLVIALYTGEAGWAAGDHQVGICHAEMQAAREDAPAKLRVIKLVDLDASSKLDSRFQTYFGQITPFYSGPSTWEEAEEAVRAAAVTGLLDLAKLGTREARKGKYHFGNALDWSRLDFRARKRAIEATMVDALSGRSLGDPENRLVELSVGGELVVVRCHAVPGAMSIAPARELVGQPHLDDHTLVEDMGAAAGPIHLIGCQKGVTERQASTLLGTEDATFVTPPFGVYAADEVQKSQLVFLRDCRDETSTRIAVQRFVEWLGQSGEETFLGSRARGRKRIVTVIAEERESHD